MERDEFKAVIGDVREATNIVDLIGDTVPLKRGGTYWLGRSPWNQDKDPSLRVWDYSGTWRDFSGGGDAGGDCFDWIQYRDGCSFLEALTTLAGFAGVQLPSQDKEAFRRAVEDAASARRVQSLLTFAAGYCHATLPDDAREWIHDTWGITDETIESLRIGMSDGSLFEALCEDAGASEDEALSTGLFTRDKRGRVHEFFAGRVLFWYWHAGRAVYAVARKTPWTPDQAWEASKYKKLRIQSDRAKYVSRHIRNSWFFNEDGARHGTGPLIITEGVTDCIAAMQHGFRVTSPVTTRFSRRDLPKLQELARYAEKLVVINDNERPSADGRRPGLEGALDSASVLHEGGHDVRIALPPRPDDVDKVDLCDFLRGGADPLRSLIAKAPTYPQFLIDTVPQDTHPAELDRALEPALRAASRCGHAERKFYVDLIAARFDVGSRTAQSMVKRAGERSSGSEDGPRMRGEIVRDARVSRYLADPPSKGIAVSSFVVDPVRRLATPDEGEVWEVDIVTESGVTVRTQLPQSAFRSRAALLAKLPTSDAQWTGSDDHVQGLLRQLSSQQVPSVRGTKLLGFDAGEKGACWAVPSHTLTREGSTDAVAYVDTGASLARRVGYEDHPIEAVKRAACEILPRLQLLNDRGCMLTIIGWFFASLVRPRFQSALGSFPFLCIHGQQGAGKTSLASHVLWPLVGVTDPKPYSAGQTEFATLRLLSSSSSVPVVMDEYKPYTMPRARKDGLHQICHENFVGAAPERGRADQTTVSYPLLAPLCLVGETRPNVPALVERMVPARPSKDLLAVCEEAFRVVVESDPSILASSVVRWSLEWDTLADYALALDTVNVELPKLGLVVPHRVRQNAAVMVAGLFSYERFAEEMGASIDEPDIPSALRAMLGDLYDQDAGAVRSQLDVFVEELSAMAVLKRIEKDREWTTVSDGVIGLHFDSAHAAYCEHERKIDTGIEIPDKQSLRRQLRDELSREGGYVRDLRALTYFGQARRRAVVIDVRRAALRGVTLDGFSDAGIPAAERREAERTRDLPL